MNIITTLAAGAPATVQTPSASWDLLSFFENANAYAVLAGGGFLALLGTVGVIWGGTLLIKKLMAGQSNQDSWLKIILLIIVGGALMASGFTLISSIAKGGQKTIEDLGSTIVLFESSVPQLSLLASSGILG